MEARNQETLRPNPAALMGRQHLRGQGRDEDEDESGDDSDQEVLKLFSLLYIYTHP